MEWGGRGHTFAGEGLDELDAPLGLGTVNLEHGDTHDEDDDSGDELEDTYGQNGKLESVD